MQLLLPVKRSELNVYRVSKVRSLVRQALGLAVCLAHL